MVTSFELGGGLSEMLSNVVYSIAFNRAGGKLRQRHDAHPEVACNGGFQKCGNL